MLFQLGGGFLSRVPVTFLKDAYGSFVGAINFAHLIVAAFIPAAQNVSAKLIPLEFDNSEDHFLFLFGCFLHTWKIQQVLFQGFVLPKCVLLEFTGPNMCNGQGVQALGLC